MIVDAFRLEPYGAGWVLCTWTSEHPTWIIRAYVDGQLAACDGRPASTTERSIVIPWPSGETHAVEIHEVEDADEPLAPVNVAAFTRPVISWTATAAAERYRLYWRDDYAGADELLFDQPVTPDNLGICTIDCPIPLDGRGGRWQFLRVEAVDKYGHQSTRLSWVYRAVEPPDAPALTVSAGSSPGLYNISLNSA